MRWSIVVQVSALVSSLVAVAALSSSVESGARLQISGHGHYIETESGRPFFYLGDTAWELFHRLSKSDTLYYLDTRQKQRFNVIQAVLLAEYGGLTEPNAEGNLPLVDLDPAKPNERYFAHVDWVVEEARKRGLFIGMLPTWGDKVRKDWGTGPVVFTPENAKVYGRFLGNRYRNAPNVIWILGGDRKANGQEEIWRNMARAIQEADGGRHLITYHPQGGLSSSKFWPNENWLSFHMMQSGHGARDIANYRMVANDVAITPAKPVIDGEPRYEDHPVNWKPENGYFDDFDVRQGEYWAVFAGAAGATYGCHDIWQFLDSKHAPVSSARTPWKKAIHLPGANQMQYLKALMLSRDYFSRVPAQEVLAANYDGAGHLQATRGKGYVFVYTPLGSPIAIKAEALGSASPRASWFSPRTGKLQPTAGGNNGNGNHVFTPPGKPQRGNDWVLVLDGTA